MAAAIWLAAVFVGGNACASGPSAGEAEQVWLASRADGRQALVYFDAVLFGKSFPYAARKLYPAAGFGIPMLIPEGFAAEMRRRPGVVHVAAGEKYDLITGGVRDEWRTATVTAAVGWTGDEEVGNDSYLGALLQVDDPSIPLSEDWFVARRHRTTSDREKGQAAMLPQPAPFDVMTRIAALMNDRMRLVATSATREKAAKTAPAFTVQRFRLSGGELRYYVRCEWVADKPFLLGAWIAGAGDLHVSGVEKATASYGFETDLLRLENVVDLGHGRTGVVVSINGEEGAAVRLLEYGEGGVGKMRVLQELSAGE